MTLARAGASVGSSPSMSDSSKRRGAMNKFGSRRETSFGQDEISVPPSPVDPLDPADRGMCAHVLGAGKDREHGRLDM
jgi:hypothetical protein